MARPEGALSKDLERSMNQQVRITTFEEHLLRAEMIDTLDDQRREKAFGLAEWRENMAKAFDKELTDIIKIRNPLEKDTLLLNYRKKVRNFNKLFTTKFNEVKELEIYYEDLDDELREWLINYSSICREKLKIENSAIEKRLIAENLSRKKKKA